MKRKAPASRAKPVTPVKREKIVDGQDAGEELSDFNPVNDELEESATYLLVYKSSVTGKMVLDEGTQIVLSKYMFAAKVETMILKNEVSTMKEQKSTVVSSSPYEVICEDPDLMKHFVGLTASQFEVLFSFLNDVFPPSQLFHNFPGLSRILSLERRRLR